MAEAFKLYKLIILYMLDKVDFPLTNSQISEFILNEGYTTYFKLQQALSELLDSGFIREESTHTRTFYHLTADTIFHVGISIIVSFYGNFIFQFILFITEKTVNIFLDCR